MAAFVSFDLTNFSSGGDDPILHPVGHQDELLTSSCWPVQCSDGDNDILIIDLTNPGS